MSPAKACEDQPGGEVDAVAVSPVSRAAAGNVEHARDAPGLVDAHYVSCQSVVVVVDNVYLVVLSMDSGQRSRALHSQGIPC